VDRCRPGAYWKRAGCRRHPLEKADKSKTERNDIEAELSLRKDEPPYDLVTAEMESFPQKVGAGVEEWRQDPNRKEEEENSLLADFNAFLDGLDKQST